MQVVHFASGDATRVADVPLSKEYIPFAYLDVVYTGVPTFTSPTVVVLDHSSESSLWCSNTVLVHRGPATPTLANPLQPEDDVHRAMSTWATLCGPKINISGRGLPFSTEVNNAAMVAVVRWTFAYNQNDTLEQPSDMNNTWLRNRSSATASIIQQDARDPLHTVKNNPQMATLGFLMHHLRPLVEGVATTVKLCTGSPCHVLDCKCRCLGVDFTLAGLERHMELNTAQYDLHYQLQRAAANDDEEKEEKEEKEVQGPSQQSQPRMALANHEEKQEKVPVDVPNRSAAAQRIKNLRVDERRDEGPLYPHQLSDARWVEETERAAADATRVLHPFFIEFQATVEQEPHTRTRQVYLDSRDGTVIAAPFTSDGREEAPRGVHTSPALHGVIGETPGLGKTVAMLYAIERALAHVYELLSRQQHSQRRSGGAVGPPRVHTTLVVVRDASLIEQWNHANQVFFDPPMSSKLLNELNGDDLDQYDMVFTVAEDLCDTDHVMVNGAFVRLCDVLFHRLVVDESQTFTPSGTHHRMTLAMHASHYWVVTATPLQGQADSTGRACDIAQLQGTLELLHHPVWGRCLERTNHKGVTFEPLKEQWNNRRWLAWRWLAVDWVEHHIIRHDTRPLIEAGVLPRSLNDVKEVPMTAAHAERYNQVVVMVKHNQLMTHGWPEHEASYWRKSTENHKLAARLINSARAAQLVQAHVSPAVVDDVRSRLPQNADPRTVAAIEHVLAHPLDLHDCDCGHRRPLPIIMPRCGHLCCVDCAKPCFPLYTPDGKANGAAKRSSSSSTTIKARRSTGSAGKDRATARLTNDKGRMQAFQQWQSSQWVSCPVCTERVPVRLLHDLLVRHTPTFDGVSIEQQQDSDKVVVPANVTSLIEDVQKVLTADARHHVLIYTENEEELSHIAQQLEDSNVPFVHYLTGNNQRVSRDDMWLTRAGHAASTIASQALVRFGLDTRTSPSVMASPQRQAASREPHSLMAPRAPVMNSDRVGAKYGGGTTVACFESQTVAPFAGLELSSLAGKALPSSFYVKVRCRASKRRGRDYKPGWFVPEKPKDNAAAWDQVGQSDTVVATRRVSELEGDMDDVDVIDLTIRSQNANPDRVRPVPVTLESAQEMLRRLDFEVAPIILPTVSELLRTAGDRINRGNTDMEELMADLLRTDAEKRVATISVEFCSNSPGELGSDNVVASINVELQVVPVRPFARRVMILGKASVAGLDMPQVSHIFAADSIHDIGRKTQLQGRGNRIGSIHREVAFRTYVDPEDRVVTAPAPAIDQGDVDNDEDSGPDNLSSRDRKPVKQTQSMREWDVLSARLSAMRLVESVVEELDVERKYDEEEKEHKSAEVEMKVSHADASSLSTPVPSQPQQSASQPQQSASQPQQQPPSGGGNKRLHPSADDSTLCGHCHERERECYCRACDEYLCLEGHTLLHKRRALQTPEHRAVTSLCQFDLTVATYDCRQCGMLLCDDCEARRHHNPAKRDHTPFSLAVVTSSTTSLSSSSRPLLLLSAVSQGSLALSTFRLVFASNPVPIVWAQYYNSLHSHMTPIRVELRHIASSSARVDASAFARPITLCVELMFQGHVLDGRVYNDEAVFTVQPTPLQITPRDGAYCLFTFDLKKTFRSLKGICPGATEGFVLRVRAVDEAYEQQILPAISTVFDAQVKPAKPQVQ